MSLYDPQRHESRLGNSVAPFLFCSRSKNRLAVPYDRHSERILQSAASVLGKGAFSETLTGRPTLDVF